MSNDYFRPTTATLKINFHLPVINYLRAMDFELPVNYDGKQLLFPAQLLQYGYTFKIEVDVNGTKVLFEPDEQRDLRALLTLEEMEKGSTFSKGLLTAIAESLQDVIK